MIAYLNGRFQDADACTISPLDRGFLFGDSVYEVLPVYHRAVFRCDDHLRRLDYSLDSIGIANPHSDKQWKEVFSELISRSDLTEFSIYLQISRGQTPIREHAPANDMHPTVFAMGMPLRTMPNEISEKGVSVMTVDDIRWARCDIKSTNLLASVLLGMQMKTKAIYEAIMIRENHVTEGASSNVFIVNDNFLLTPPLSNKVLAGITRQVVLEIAQQLKVNCEEKELSRMDLLNADEIWLTSSTRNIVPVTCIDGQQLGQGTPGELWHKFSQALIKLPQT